MIFQILLEIDGVEEVGRLDGRPDFAIVVTPAAKQWLREASHAKRCLRPIPAQGLGNFLPLSDEQQALVSALGKGASFILWPPRLSPWELYIIERHGRPLKELASGYRRYWQIPGGDDGFVPATLPGLHWDLYPLYRWVVDQIRWWTWGRRTLRKARELSDQLTAAGFPPPTKKAI